MPPAKLDAGFWIVLLGAICGLAVMLFCNG